MGRAVALIVALAAATGWQVCASGESGGGLARQRPASFDAARAFEHLKQIVTIGPRPAGSPQLGETRAYITRQMSSYGLKVEEQRFTAQTPIGRSAMAE